MTHLIDEASDRGLHLRAGLNAISPQQAELILANHRFPGQIRDLTNQGKAHVANLAESMRALNWLEGDTLPFAVVGSEIFILNGHHRLSSQVAADCTVRWNVVLHACADMNEAKTLYRRFDVVQRGRTPEQIMSASDVYDDLNISRSVGSTLYACAPFILSGFKFDHNKWDDAIKKNPESRIEFMMAYGAEAKAWSEACASAPTNLKRFMQTQGAFSVALVAFKHQPDVAQAFWQGLSDNVGLNKGDPRHTYIASILAGHAKQTIEYRARQMAIAWNAYFMRRPLSLIRVLNTTPFSIAGTPYA